LINTALDLLSAGGEAAVTTVSVTRGAGVVQSVFYRHFASVEECLATVAERVTGEIREAVANSRQQMYDMGPGADGDLVEGFRKMLGLVSRQRPIMELFLRYRSDPLALQGVMYRFARGLSTDLAGQLRAEYGEAGLSGLPAGWVEALADDLVAVSLAAIEAFLEGRGLPVEDAAQRLAACSTAMILAVLQMNPGKGESAAISEQR
jgi:AcrR family transcriptional regulator